MAIKRSGKEATVNGRFVFDELEDSEPPKLVVDRIDAQGGAHPVDMGTKGEFALDPAFAGQRNTLRVSGPTQEDARQFRYDELLSSLAKDPTYVLPYAVWGRWRGRLRCVSGRVQRCRRPYLISVLAESSATMFQTRLAAAAQLSLEFARPEGAALHSTAKSRVPTICRPVCDGTVSVYVQTCCCPWFDPGVILHNICELIDCTRPVIGRPVEEIPGVGPIPDPVGPISLEVVNVLQTMKRSLDGEPDLPGVDEIIDLYRHHKALSDLPQRSQVAYVKAYPELQSLYCHCTTRLVATVPIHEDGTFDACFRLAAPGRGCTQRVTYVVTQPTATGGDVVYDGRTSSRTFALTDEADLRVRWSARACDRDDLAGDGVFLNRVGTTGSEMLVRSVEQDGELSFAPLAAGDGLVNGGANVWGGTLALRYTFNPALKALGATYYRVRTQQVDDAGNAIGTPADHETPIAWGLFQGTTIVSTVIGPNPNPTPGGEGKLYQIPYYADGWDFDADSFHAFVDTTGFAANGRYLLVIDIFNAAGTLMVPTNAGGTAAFTFQRKHPVDATHPDVWLTAVPQRALANLFRVDNTKAVAAITGLHQTGSVNLSVYTGCQFLVGPPADGVQLYYQAHQARGWLSTASLSLTEGIGGPTTSLLTGALSTTDTGSPPATGETPVKTIGDLLGKTHPKCSFAATLQVTTRHTNGSGALTNLWGGAVAAFALEQTAP